MKNQTTKDKPAETKPTTRHSPRPWFAAGQALKPHAHALIGIGNGATHIAYVSITPAMSPGEAEANTHLIVSSPDLLAAAEAILARLTAYPTHLPETPEMRDLRAAIAKARR